LSVAQATDFYAQLIPLTVKLCCAKYKIQGINNYCKKEENLNKLRTVKPDASAPLITER